VSNQFIRKCGLIVYAASSAGQGAPSSTPSGTGQPGNPINISGPGQPLNISPSAPGVDLSAFRIQFKTTAMDVDVPPEAIIRVYNLSNSTVQNIQNEFQNVTLQAGYENGNFGVIFQGSIIRIRKGRLSNIDTFVDMLCGNLDAVYNFGFVSGAIKSGSSQQDALDSLKTSVANSPAAQTSPNALAAGVKYGSIPDSFGTGGTLPRGKVQFGLARDYWTDIANSTGTQWSIGPDGTVNFVQSTGYLPGNPVPINSQTGMIGVPEATQQGIEVKTLLNPNIKNGTQILLDNASITTTAVTNPTAYGDFSLASAGFTANTNTDGSYKSIVVEHEGDTRGAGNDWFTRVVCLSIDPSANPNASVPAGGPSGLY
jgi:hypothetical protein